MFAQGALRTFELFLPPLAAAAVLPAALFELPVTYRRAVMWLSNKSLAAMLTQSRATLHSQLYC